MTNCFPVVVRVNCRATNEIVVTHVVRLALSAALAVSASAAQASDCITIMSGNDPSQKNVGVTCKRVARNSNNGNLGFWRCCPDDELKEQSQ